MAEKVLPVRITVKEQQAVTAIKKLNKELKETGSTLKFSEKGVSKYNHSLGSIAKQAAVASAGFMTMAGAVNTVKRAVVGVVTDFARFEQSLANVGTLLDKNTNLWNTFANDVFKISSKFGKDATEVNRGLYDVISAGITDSAEALKALDLATGAATAGMSDVNTAVKAGVSVMNAFGLESSDLIDILNIQFDTVKRGVIIYEEMAQAQAVLLSPAQRLGVSIREMYTGIAELTKNGQRAELATVSLARAFDSMVEKKDVFKEIGVDVFNAKGEFAGLDKILMQLNGAFKGMNTEQKNALFETLNFEKRAARAFNVLIDKAEDYGTTLGQVGTDANAMTDAVDVALDTLSSQWAIFVQDVKNDGKELFKPAADSLKEFLKIYNNWRKDSNLQAATNEAFGSGDVSQIGAFLGGFEIQGGTSTPQSSVTGAELVNKFNKERADLVKDEVEAELDIIKRKRRLKQISRDIAAIEINRMREMKETAERVKVKRTQQQISGFMPGVQGFGGQAGIFNRQMQAGLNNLPMSAGAVGQRGVFERQMELGKARLEKEEKWLKEKEKKEKELIDKWNKTADKWNSTASAMANFEQAFGLSNKASSVLGGIGGVAGGYAQFASGDVLGGSLNMLASGKGLVDTIFGKGSGTPVVKLTDALENLDKTIRSQTSAQQFSGFRKLNFGNTRTISANEIGGKNDIAPIIKELGLNVSAETIRQEAVAGMLGGTGDFGENAARLLNETIMAQNSSFFQGLQSSLGLTTEGIIGAFSQGGEEAVRQLQEQARLNALFSTSQFQELSEALGESITGDVVTAAQMFEKEMGAIDVTGTTDELIDKLGDLFDATNMNTEATKELTRVTNVPTGLKINDILT
jgi:TP901 family phage tail tape measure protein